MLMILNDVMPYLGLILCLTVWTLERFNTKPFAIQFTYMIWIVAMISLYIADNNPAFNPTPGSITARYLFLFSIFTVACYVFCVTKKMRRQNQTIKQLKQQIEDLSNSPQ